MATIIPFPSEKAALRRSGARKPNDAERAIVDLSSYRFVPQASAAGRRQDRHVLLCPD
jgi:hypothetical protein